MDKLAVNVHVVSTSHTMLHTIYRTCRGRESFVRMYATVRVLCVVRHMLFYSTPHHFDERAFIYARTEIVIQELVKSISAFIHDTADNGLLSAARLYMSDVRRLYARHPR